MKQILEIAEKAARVAAVEILSHWDSLEIDFKGINDLVTQADVASERLIKGVIKETYPTHEFYAEESTNRADLLSDHLWIIDPLDGTTNFAAKLPQFSISIAYAQKGVIKAGIVYDVAKNEMFSASVGNGAHINGNVISVSSKTEISQSIVCTGFAYERGPLMRATLKSIEALFEQNLRGIRRLGSAALDFCWVACGRLDGYFEYSLSPWDFAAGSLILVEAGGRICAHDGSPFSLKSTGAIVAGQNLFESLCALARYSD